MVTTMAQWLDSRCLLLPASSSREDAREGDGVHFYRHPFGRRYFLSQWSLLDVAWPEGSSAAGYIVDRSEMTAEELTYLGPLPRLSRVTIPFQNRETAHQARETWAVSLIDSGTVRREERQIIYLEWSHSQAKANSLFNLYAAGIVLEDGRLVLLQSNRPDLIPALLDAQAACLPAPFEVRSFDLPAALHLSQGAYDIPWHLEPDEDLTLARHDISPASTNSEYIPVGIDDLERITPLFKPAAGSAYSFTLPPVWDGVLPAAEAALAANPIVQVCLGCVTFNSKATVLSLEFADRETAAEFVEAIYAYEFGRHGGKAVAFVNGAIQMDEYTAYLHAGRFFYVINSWMPDTISAFLRSAKIDI